METFAVLKSEGLERLQRRVKLRVANDLEVVGLSTINMNVPSLIRGPESDHNPLTQISFTVSGFLSRPINITIGETYVKSHATPIGKWPPWILGIDHQTLYLESERIRKFHALLSMIGNGKPIKTSTAFFTRPSSNLTAQSIANAVLSFAYHIRAQPDAYNTPFQTC